MRVFFVSLVLFSVLFTSFTSGSNIGLIENEIWQGNLTPVRFSAVAWGDIDNDGDLDLSLSGCLDDGGQDCENGAIAKVYINNGTSLIENSTWQYDLVGVGHSGTAWGDIDNDGDLDLVLTGCTVATSVCSGNLIAKVYINNGTSLIENSTWQQDLAGIWQGNIAFADINNDGRLDLALIGASESNEISKVYINNGTTFVENNTWESYLVGLRWSSLTFADLNNDGKIDIGITGKDSNSDKKTKIYINNGTTFVENNTWEMNLIQVYDSGFIFGDYDNDNDMDLVLMGCCDHLHTYTNNGVSFVESQRDIAAGGDLNGIFSGSIAFGDYNNDGDLDFVGIGRESGRDMVYKNNGSGYFLFDNSAAQGIVHDDTQHGALAWSDVDGDADLDLIATGYGYGDGGSLKAKIYLNNITTPNLLPSPPSSNFDSSYSEDELKLDWGSGSDSETPTLGIYYNLRVGTCSECHDIVSGVYGSSSGGEWRGGGPASGYFGNMMQRKSITLNLYFDPGTTIYWAVQTIDTGLAKSEWSEEQVYTIPDTVPPGISNVRNGTATWNSAVILFDTDKQGNATIQYGTTQGNLNLSASNPSLATSHSVTLTNLEDNTTYYYNVTSCNQYGYCNTSGVYNFTTSICIPSWSCSSWGSCQPSNTQTCSQWVDANECGESYTGSNTRSCVHSPKSGSGPSGGYTPPKTEEYTFDEITPGIPVTKELSEGIAITIGVKTIASNVDIHVTKHEIKPTAIPRPIIGKTYHYLEIDVSGIEDSDIAEAYIEFKVSREWINKNNIDGNTVTLHRYHGNEWQALETAFATADTGYYYYKAKTPGFSYFAITGEETGETSGLDNDTKPGLLCTPNSKRCSGNELQYCSPAGTVWLVKELCHYGCDLDRMECKSLETGESKSVGIEIIIGVIGLVGIVAVVEVYMKRFRRNQI